MLLQPYEVPVAFSLVSWIQDHTPHFPHPIARFACYWAAFNNIYVTIADRRGLRPRFRTERDGSIRRRVDGVVSVPIVDPVGERKQLEAAFDEFTEQLKHQLIVHPNTAFFVYRTPRWKDHAISRDGNGHGLNGVLNVGHTLNVQQPVWSPVDTQTYERYLRDKVTGRDALAKQLLFLLYTVRNNAFHGGKRVDDSYDGDVLDNALPILETIVNSLVDWQQV
jgi:hypothetical protein